MISIDLKNGDMLRKNQFYRKEAIFGPSGPLPNGHLTNWHPKDLSKIIHS
ncbi:MAG: hypothetical protein MUO40_12430 [Anaerolineaceae bacterium]|nr:hypothetical protein [Anaerolineaceae bacterium]